jgi:hypothetical protein
MIIISITLVVGHRVLLGAVLACCTYILCSPQLWAPGSKVPVASYLTAALITTQRIRSEVDI